MTSLFISVTVLGVAVTFNSVVIITLIHRIRTLEGLAKLRHPR